MKKVSNNLNINIGNLIEKIGPLNNQIRNSDGLERISLMWEMGDILIKEGINKIHPVAWEIQRKSYITRDLLSYCYRIKKKWPNKLELQKLFCNVQSYSAFREALPLIENEKFILSEREVESIIKWLNQENPSVLKKKLILIKQKYINIKNDRRQRLNELQNEVIIFKKFSKHLIDLIKKEDVNELEKLKKDVGDDRLLKLSQMCMAISNDNYKGPSNINTEKLPNIVGEFVEKMLPINSAKKEKKARFRRLVPVENIIVVADLLNSLRIGESPLDVKKRLIFNM